MEYNPYLRRPFPKSQKIYNSSSILSNVFKSTFAPFKQFSGVEYSSYRTTSSTDYYITFQTKSGERIEFSVEDSEYGLLIEGDEGVLSYQGTRYLGFKRV